MIRRIKRGIRLLVDTAVNPRYDYVIKLGGQPSDKYIDYRKRLLEIKYDYNKPEAHIVLDKIKDEVMKDPELTNREKAKILQEIVNTRVFTDRGFYAWERNGYRGLFFTPRRNSILRAYGVKPIRTKLRKIIERKKSF